MTPDLSDGRTPTVRVPSAFAALRLDAERLLSEWVAPSDELEALRRRLLQVAESDRACMWREGGPVHFTAGLVLFDPELTHVALTLHGKAKRWFQFGGHFETADTDVMAAAVREGHEESGNTSFRVGSGLVHIDAHELPSAFGRCREHLDLRFAGVTSDDVLGVSDESDDVRWWPLEALPADTEPSLCEAIALSRDLVRVEFG